jgi:hypothetical protein
VRLQYGTLLRFDIDGDVTIDEDSEVAMEVIVDLNDTDDATTRYPNGTTIKASITSTGRQLHGQRKVLMI